MTRANYKDDHSVCFKVLQKQIENITKEKEGFKLENQKIKKENEEFKAKI